MTSEEIKEFVELKENLLTLQDYIKIVSTSPQIKSIFYNKPYFDIFTNDNYEFKVKVKTRLKS